MDNIRDSTPVKDLVMPGSHDAGVWHDPRTRLGNILKTNAMLHTSSIAAQYEDLRAQATAGSRWFDIRMFKTPTRWFEASLRPDYVGGYKMKMRAAHVPGDPQEGLISWGIMQSPGLGGYGASTEEILDSLTNFVKSATSEFVVIRFSHCPEPRKVVREIDAYYTENTHHVKYRFKRPVPFHGLGNTAISALRGKVVLIFDGLFAPHIGPHSGRESWAFSYDKGTSLTADATCCGDYPDSPNVARVAAANLAAIDQHNTAHGNDGHLCFVYWQVTERNPLKQAMGDGSIYASATTAAGGGAGYLGQGTHANTLLFRNDMAKVKVPARDVPANVVSYDYVNSATSKLIVEMNAHRAKAPWVW
jgi:hypothetical protein